MRIVKMALERKPAYWTCEEGNDVSGPLYYFAPTIRRPPPYKVQREVTTILDLADDGTLAGVELIMGDLPPPPKEK
jgi:hypothetical protein